jgi:CzcA family heavy metal efflux pump
MAFGISRLQKMPVDIYPEFNPPLVEVQTEALGLSAEEVESLITTPMEADLLAGVAWLDSIYSESVTGLSSIVMVFEPGTDPIKARLMVQERLNQAYALPNVSKPPVMLQPLSSSNRVMMIGLSSTEHSLIDMGVVARWNIRPSLMGVPGVANVAIWGGRERQLQIQVNPEELQAAGVTLDQVIETAGEALWVSPLSFLESSSPGTAGWIDTPNQRLGIHHSLPISSAEDLSRVSVAGAEGLLLGDVAQVVVDHQPLIGDAVVNDTSGILLVVEKFPGANTLDVTHRLEATLDAMAPGLSGINVDPTVFRPADYIESASNNLSTALIISAVLIFLVIGAFFFQWRTALVSLVVIPVSLVAATFVLYLRGATLNSMLLAGLAVALAVIIDDAIIDVENIARRLRENSRNGNPKPAMAVALEAALEVRNNIGFATLIILLVTMPFFFIQGLSGSFLQPLMVSYVLAVLVSVATALILTPAFSTILLADAPLGRGESPIVSGLKRAYNGTLGQIVRGPAFAPALAGIVILAGVLVLPLLRVSLVPSFKQTDILIQWEGAPGTSRTEMNRIMTQAGQELRSIRGVLNVGSHIGRAETGDQVVGINSGELWVKLDPNANYDAAFSAVQNVINGYPGFQLDMQAYQPERTVEALTAAGDDIIVRIYGYDLAVLKEKAQEISKNLSEINGVATARAELGAEEAQVEIQVNLDAAEQYGIKPGDVRRVVATLLSGLHVGSLYEDQKVFDVVVWGTPELRNSLTDIGNLLIDLPAGGQVKLSEVAEVRIAPAPVVIRRDTVSRFVDVQVNVSNRSVTAVAADIEKSLATVEFPFEFHAELLGGFAERQAAQQRIWILAGAALIGIVVILQASFGSWRLAIASLLTLPMALAGGALAALLSGGVLSLGSAFGFLALFGIAVRNTIGMTNHFDHLERNEGVSFGSDLVLRGAGERFAPTLTSLLTTALAFLPFVFLGNIAGLELIRPMAIVILGGLVTTALLNLFVVPGLYVRYGANREQEIDLVPAPVPGD